MYYEISYVSLIIFSKVRIRRDIRNLVMRMDLQSSLVN